MKREPAKRKAMDNRTIRSSNTAFILAVFTFFAVCSLFVVLFGANVYHKVVSELDGNSEVRTSISYVSNKVRAADARDVTVQTVNGHQMLVIGSQYDGKKYSTCIYQYQGSLYELFTGAEIQPVLGNGDKITPLSGFTVSKSGDRLTVSATGKDSRSAAVELMLV